MVEYKDEVSRARTYGQEHIFRFWNDLDSASKQRLLKQASAIDYDLMRKLFLQREPQIDPREIKPPRLWSKQDQGPQRDEALEIGETAIENGELALFTVAGGQASRLGYDGPKGCFPATPVAKKPIFEVLAQRILAFEKKHECRLQWFIMTSKANDAATKAFFDAHEYFGLSADQVHFFTQGMIPAVDLDGKLFLKEKDEIFRNPNGTGGIYDALVNSGAIARMKKSGVKYLSYFQIDNPLIDFIDPLFLDYHTKERAEMSTKVVEKAYPEESVGLVVEKNAKASMIEYFDLSKEMACQRDETGKLKYHAANIAMHIINIEFIERVQKEDLLPYHKSKKQIPHLDIKGRLVNPESKNGIKFERLVFDVLDQARNSVTYKVLREEEFAPIKNAQGKDSPESANQIQNDLYRSWLSKAGVTIPESLEWIEISPLFALDKEEFVRKVRDRRSKVSSALEGKTSFCFEGDFKL